MGFFASFGSAFWRQRSIRMKGYKNLIFELKKLKQLCFNQPAELHLIFFFEMLPQSLSAVWQNLESFGIRIWPEDNNR